jgi:hypothetical protein
MSISRGFEASYNVVSKALKGRAERQLQERLGQESERYGVTEGAYGQGLGENVQQVQGLQQQALEQARYQGASEEDLARIESQYAPSIAELTRRQGLTAPDYTIASRSMRPEDTFATREAAEMAAKPMRTQGLAGVYRQAGEIEKADELLERADQQKLTGLQTRAAEMTVKERERAIEAQQKLDSFEAWRAENPNVTGSQLKDVARSQFKLNDDQLLKVTSTITGLAENDLKQFQLEMKNAIKGKDLKGLVELYNTDDRLDPNTDLKVVRGKNGAVTLSFVDKQGNPVSSQNFSSEALATAFLNKQATEPDQVAEWLLGVQKTQAAIAASNRSSPGTPSLSQKVADAEKALGRKLTEDEKAIMVGLRGRPGTGRAPTQAEITSRANLYLNSDQTGELTVEDAVAMAERDLLGAPAPMNPQRSLVDAAINPQPAAATRPPAGGLTPAGQQVLGLYNTVVPPAARRPAPPPPAQTRQEQLRGFYVQQPR